MNQPVLELVESAEDEFYDILEYYKEFDPALPYDFLLEFEQATQRLIKFPNSGHPYLHQTKRILLERFPHAIVYKYYPEGVIVVFAIMHPKREPGYWEERL